MERDDYPPQFKITYSSGFFLVIWESGTEKNNHKLLWRKATYTV